MRSLRISELIGFPMKEALRSKRTGPLAVLGCIALFLSLARWGYSAESFQFSPPRGWNSSDTFVKYKTWKGDQAKKQFISVIEDPELKTSTSPPSDSRLIEIFKKGAEVTNGLAGITQYEIGKLERETLPNGGYRIALLGTYKDNTGALVRFEEWKFFFKTGYSQIHYSETGTASLDRKAIDPI